MVFIRIFLDSEVASLGMCCASSLADAIFPSNNDADSRSLEHAHRHYLNATGCLRIRSAFFTQSTNPLDLYNNVFNDKKGPLKDSDLF